MAILFVGSEKGDFIEIGNPASVTSSSYIPTDNVRGGLDLGYNTQGKSLEARFLSSSRVSCFLNSYITTTTSTGMLLACSLNSGNTPFVRKLTSNSYNSLQYWNGSSWIEFGRTYDYVATLVRYGFDVLVDSVNGYVRYYENGYLIAEATGLNTASMTSNIDSMKLYSIITSSNQNTYYSEVIIADEDAVNLRLLTLAPTAGGANTSWTGTYADVDEIGTNYSDIIYSGTADELETFVMNDIDPAIQGTRTIKALVIAATIRKGITGPQDVKAVTRIGGTDYINDSFTPQTSRSSKKVILENSPATGVKWTTSEVNGMEIGVKSIA